MNEFWEYENIHIDLHEYSHFQLAKHPQNLNETFCPFFICVGFLDLLYKVPKWFIWRCIYFTPVFMDSQLNNIDYFPCVHRWCLLWTKLCYNMKVFEQAACRPPIQLKISSSTTTVETSMQSYSIMILHRYVVFTILIEWKGAHLYNLEACDHQFWLFNSVGHSSSGTKIKFFCLAKIEWNRVSLCVFRLWKCDRNLRIIDIATNEQIGSWTLLS